MMFKHKKRTMNTYFFIFVCLLLLSIGNASASIFYGSNGGINIVDEPEPITLSQVYGILYPTYGDSLLNYMGDDIWLLNSSIYVGNATLVLDGSEDARELRLNSNIPSRGGYYHLWGKYPSTINPRYGTILLNNTKILTWNQTTLSSEIDTTAMKTIYLYNSSIIDTKFESVNKVTVMDNSFGIVQDVQIINSYQGLQFINANNLKIENIKALNITLTGLSFTNSQVCQLSNYHFYNPLSFNEAAATSANGLSINGGFGNIIQDISIENPRWGGIYLSGDESSDVIKNVTVIGAMHNGIDIHGANYISLENISVYGSFSNDFLITGPWTPEGTHHISLTDVSSYNAHYRGIQGGVNVFNISIDNSTIVNSRDNGLTFFDSSNLSFNAISIFNSARSGFVLSDYGGGTDNVTISNSNFYANSYKDFELILNNVDTYISNVDYSTSYVGPGSNVVTLVDNIETPTTSGTSLSFTPSATSFESTVGQSTNFVVSSDQTFTSSTWYFNDAEVASGATTYTHNWNTAGTHEVRFDGTAAAGTISKTWTVTVPEPANTGVSSVSIAPSSTVVAPGESFSLDVYIDPGQPLSGSQFNMHYSNIASASSVQDCGLFSVDGLSSTFNNGEIDNVNSAITGVYSAIVGSGAVSEACAMATVNMVAGSTSGIVDFTLSNLVLSDANSAPAPYDVSYASVLVDTAPEFNALSAVTADETDSISFTVAATDAEGDDLTYSSTSLPGSATFDANTATFTWTPDVGDAGTYTASFAVTDGYLNDSVSVTITVEELNNAPVITLFEPADGTEFEEGSIVDINVAGTDSDGQNLNYVIKINDEIVSTSADYSWVTDYSSAGTHTITAIVSDGIDDVSSTHSITISDLHPRWDVNEDGNVNVLDITLVGQNYGLAYASELPRWDVNQDGTINVQDLSIVSGHFGETV